MAENNQKDTQTVASAGVSLLRDFSHDSLDLDDKTVLVTGGTGSFGRAFIKSTLERFSPRKVIVFSRDELKQFDMANDPEISGSGVVRFFIGDVRDRERLTTAFRDVDYVVHAAAMKHISAAEYNPFECIKTNVIGAENVVNAAIDAGVQKVIALSTDKAANPANLYGASKLASDKIFIAAKSLVGSGAPHFAVVRYGNVLGSRGSVVPFFRQLIANNADSLPITDERMTRFWITVQQGVDFVMSCFHNMHGGEIFIPKIPSTTIVDLAAAMSSELPIREVGIRPGEKLHEIMVTQDDARNTIELSDRYIICSPNIPHHVRYSSEASVAEDFQYTSDTNSEWLDVAAIKELLSRLNL